MESISIPKPELDAEPIDRITRRFQVVQVLFAAILVENQNEVN